MTFIYSVKIYKELTHVNLIEVLNKEKKNKIIYFNALCEKLEDEFDWWFFFEKCKCYLLKKVVENSLILNASDLHVSNSTLRLFDNGNEFNIGKYKVEYIELNERPYLKVVLG